MHLHGNEFLSIKGFIVSACENFQFEMDNTYSRRWDRELVHSTWTCPWEKVIATVHFQLWSIWRPECWLLWETLCLWVRISFLNWFQVNELELWLNFLSLSSIRMAKQEFSLYFWCILHKVMFPTYEWHWIEYAFYPYIPSFCFHFWKMWCSFHWDRL